MSRLDDVHTYLEGMRNALIPTLVAFLIQATVTGGTPLPNDMTSRSLSLALPMLAASWALQNSPAPQTERRLQARAVMNVSGVLFGGAAAISLFSSAIGTESNTGLIVGVAAAVAALMWAGSKDAGEVSTEADGPRPS